MTFFLPKCPSSFIFFNYLLDTLKSGRFEAANGSKVYFILKNSSSELSSFSSSSSSFYYSFFFSLALFCLIFSNLSDITV